MHALQMLEPSFGGINLEDIAQPQCFGVLDELRKTLSIPVWHDAFPGIFRGVLDVRAKRITEEMARATEELAALAEEQGLTDERILPSMGEIEVAARVAVAAGMKAQEQGLTRIHLSRDDLHARAIEAIRRTRAVTELLLRERIIPLPE